MFVVGKRRVEAVDHLMEEAGWWRWWMTYLLWSGMRVEAVGLSSGGGEEPTTFCDNVLDQGKQWAT